MDCKSFVLHLAHKFSMGDNAVGENAESVHMLPYDTEQELYEQFVDHYTRYNGSDPKVMNKMPSISTFRRAYSEINKKVKLRGCRGSFETCGICNHINDALKKVDSRILILRCLY